MKKLFAEIEAAIAWFVKSNAHHTTAHAAAAATKCVSCM